MTCIDCKSNKVHARDRCFTCYSRYRARMIAYGRWGGLVDTTPVREHLTALRKSGYTLRELSALTGIAYNHLGLLAGRGGPKRCKSENADAILAVTPRALP